MSKILDTYISKTPISGETQAKAEKSIPGGNSRQAGHWLPYPLTIDRAQGLFLWDVDENEYIDLTNNYTSMVHGHAYPPIVEAAERQLKNGTQWSAACKPQIELADLIVDRVPGVDQIRFCNSGTEAGNLALMIARLTTGRPNILMARFGYHGGIWEFEAGTLNMPEEHRPFTHLAQYGDLDAFKSVLAEHGSTIAGVWLEPVMGSGGVVVPPADFLEGVMAAAHDAGALFILDEVITFRLGTGGRQKELGIKPDLTMFGKLIGGGFPVGAVGGKQEHLKIFDPKNLRAYHSGTYNGNPVTMGAGAVAVRELTKARIDEMDRLGGLLSDLLAKSANKVDLPITINRIGSLLNIFLTDNPIYNIIERDDVEAVAKFHMACANHGLFIATRGMIALSTIMTEQTVHEIAERAEAAFADVANEL